MLSGGIVSLIPADRWAIEEKGFGKAVESTAYDNWPVSRFMNVIHLPSVSKRKLVVVGTIGMASSLNLKTRYWSVGGTKSIKWCFTPSICSAVSLFVRMFAPR
jgi:hypothetical protein